MRMTMMVKMMLKMMVMVDMMLVMTWLQALDAALRATKEKSLFGALKLPSADFKLHLDRNTFIIHIFDANMNTGF